MRYVARSISLGNFRRAVVVGLALAGSGCGIGEAIVAAAQNAADELVAAALESVRGSAQAAGGDAVEIGPEGGELAFADAEHPLYKTKVVIPAAALPEGLERTVLSIVPDSSYALPGTEWAALGPAVQIRLQALPGLDDVELVTAATVQVPVTVETDGDVWLAHGVADGLTILDSTDADEGAVAGLTTSFSPFVAVGEAPPDHPERPTSRRRRSTSWPTP